MRILFFSFPYDSAPGGGERYSEQTAEGLFEGGQAVTLISSSRALLKIFSRRGWETLALWGGIEPVSKSSAVIFPLTAPFFLPLLFGVLVWFRFRHGVRTLVCLSLTDKLLATLPARALGMRVIWMEHLLAGRSMLQNPFRRLYVWLSRFARLVAVSEATAASIASVGIERNRITVIYPGILPKSQGSGFLDSRRSGKPIIGAISRLSKEKNVALLLRAFAMVVKEIPEVTLQIFGDGPERRALERQAEELGIGAKTAFLGYVEGAGLRCDEFDILAVPSSRESFGLVALEAMNCGVPVVATDVGGLSELVIGGETGLLVPPEDDLAMAGALLELLHDRERSRKLGEAGQSSAVARFSLEKMKRAWIDLVSSR